MNLRHILFLIVILFPLQAFADGGGVRFSYQKIEVGSSKEWALVPIPDKAMEGTVNKAKIEAAYQALRKKKRGTYGKTKVTVSGSVPNKAKVTVSIDPKFGKYAPIIIAETVYTFTELGVPGVAFPGYTKGAVTRSDVPFPAYTLVVPLWKALGSVNSQFVQVQMPNGQLLKSNDVYRAWKAKDASVRDPLYSYLTSKDYYTVRKVMALLPDLKMPYEAKVIPLLKHPSSSVRLTALKTLEKKRNSTAVLDAVLNVMNSDKKANVALAAATFLGSAKQAKYKVQQTYYMLDRGADSDVIKAIKALGKSNTPDTIKRLEKKLEDKRKPVATAAHKSLASLNATAAQTKALSNKKVNAAIKIAIAKDLSADKTANAQLIGDVFLAKALQGSFAEEAIGRIGDSKATSARAELEKFLASKKGFLRRASADALAGRKEAASIPAFAKAIKSGTDKELMEKKAYSVMVAQKTNAVLDQAKSSNKIVQRLAFRALGERAAKEGKSAKIFSMLKKGLSNRDASIRGACALAIGRFGDKQAVAALKPLIKDKSGSVRADVAYAIGYLPEGELTDELKAYLSDKDPGVQAGAIASLGRRGEAFAWKTIKARASDKDDRVRAASLIALGKLVSKEDKQGVREVISLLSGKVTDKSSRVQLAALEALGMFREEKAVTIIALQINADDELLRIGAINALAETKHPSATDTVATVLSDSSRKIRSVAIEALVRMKDKSAKSSLENQLKQEKDKAIAKKIRDALKRI